MASPPLTDRTYAYFKVTGRGSVRPVIDALPLKSTNYWSEGEANPRSGKPYPTMRCTYESGLDDRHAMDSHLERLFAMLQPCKGQLLRLAENYELTIQCVGYFTPAGHGVHLDRTVVALAAELGLCFDMDFYYVHDMGHDLDFR